MSPSGPQTSARASHRAASRRDRRRPKPGGCGRGWRRVSARSCSQAASSSRYRRRRHGPVGPRRVLMPWPTGCGTAPTASRARDYQVRLNGPKLATRSTARPMGCLVAGGARARPRDHGAHPPRKPRLPVHPSAPGVVPGRRRRPDGPHDVDDVGPPRAPSARAQFRGSRPSGDRRCRGPPCPGGRDLVRRTALPARRARSTAPSWTSPRARSAPRGSTTGHAARRTRWDRARHAAGPCRKTAWRIPLDWSYPYVMLSTETSCRRRRDPSRSSP